MKYFHPIILLALLAAPADCSGQMILGLKAGLTLCDPVVSDRILTSNQSVVNTGKTGFYAGALADLEISKHFSYRPELSFCRIKYLETYDLKNSQPPTLERNLKELNYIAFHSDLIFRQRIGPGEIELITGGYLSLALDGKYDYTGSFGSNSGRIYASPAGFYSIAPVDYGVNLGTGFRFKNVILSIKYSYGLANIESVYDKATEMRLLNLGISYLLRKRV